MINSGIKKEINLSEQGLERLLHHRKQFDLPYAGADGELIGLGFIAWKNPTRKDWGTYITTDGQLFLEKRGGV